MRRLTLAVLLGLLLSGLVLLAPASSGSTQRVVPVRADEVTVALERTRTVTLPEPAQHVALYWRGNPHARVTVAFSPDGSSFGRPVDAGRDGAGTHSATTYGAVLAAADAVAVRVRSDRPISRLTVLAMRDGTARTTSEPTLATPAAAAATTQPPVRSRSEWGADESLRSGSPSFAKVEKLIVHHTAGSNSYSSRAEAESQLRSILYFHTQTRDWSDIGYNFVIDKFGTIYEGRWSRPYPAGVDPTGDDVDGDGVVGAHAGGWNSGTLGVAMLGTHTDADITPAARESLEALLAWSAARNGIDPAATEPFTNPEQRRDEDDPQHRRPPRLRQHRVPRWDSLRDLARPPPGRGGAQRRRHHRTDHPDRSDRRPGTPPRGPRVGRLERRLRRAAPLPGAARPPLERHLPQGRHRHVDVVPRHRAEAHDPLRLQGPRPRRRRQPQPGR